MAESTSKRSSDPTSPVVKPKKIRPMCRVRSDKSRGKTRVNIGANFPRWRTLRDRKGFRRDADLARFLLDSYESSLLTSKTQRQKRHTTSAPAGSSTESLSPDRYESSLPTSKTRRQKRHKTPAPAGSSTESLSPDRLLDFTGLTEANVQFESGPQSPRPLSPASSGEDMKTEPVTDSTDYTGLELRSCLIKSEDAEESIERKNGCGMSREEELILSNIKEEEEDGGMRDTVEVKWVDGVKVEVVEVSGK
ncbi:uncharacterized protein si:ch211-40k21.5 isoform X1 [Conger conger]|uniref:uncharacterized protein si:ch211-40k21.5 isoform X1 n=1 Tax=Conger conger TaxID=82655 RepID=UPI002A5A07A7|nr:uncharacterized protein si:ch211-40k21.5 isoform X1 [Conger conger]XP_061095824.1 uncharacterized protein si:ch211-40k21.5 isoform X1 [Conger conger]